MTSIGEHAFQDCSGLTSIAIPNSVTSIGQDAFNGCSGLTSITIGNSVTSIGGSAFYGCSSLTSVTINSNAILSSENYSLSHSIEYIFGDQVEEYVIGDNVLSIGDYAFRNCSFLESITIPTSVTSIGKSAFYGCSGLTSVTLPSTLTSTGDGSFEGCTGLTAVHITDLKAYCRISFGWYAPLFYAHKLYLNDEEVTGELVIPDGITSVSNVAFEGCTGITSVVIPEGVTSIGRAAFKSTSITSVSLPESLTSVGIEAFQDCSSLKSVTCLAKEVPSMGAEVFTNVPQSTATLYVPAASVNAYRSAAQWKEFGAITGYDTPVSSIALNKTKTTLKVRTQEKLTAIVLPEYATDKTVTWTSSDPTVATVDESGLVTAVAVGAVIITATTTDGTNLEASCEVTITWQPIYIETDFTSQFPTDYLGWNGATGYTPTQFAPMVTTNDGRTVQVCEKFNGSVAAEGTVFNRTLTGLTNGTYRIELYGAAASTKGRDTDLDTYMTAADEGNTTAVYLYATTPTGTVKQYIPVHWATSFSKVATAVLNNVVVTDGTVEIGMYSQKKFTNWEVIQIKGVTAMVDAEEQHASTLQRAQSALDDAAYVNVTGEERAALSQAIADNTTVGVRTAEAYQAAITALENATKAFTEAKVSYDGLVAAKAIVDGRSYPYATEAKKSAAEAATAAAVATSAAEAASKTNVLLTAWRQYAESSALMEGIEGAEDVTTTYIRNPKAEKAIDANVWQMILGQGSDGYINIYTDQPWTDASGSTNHRYFDGGQYYKSAWDVTLKQDVTLPAGRYQLTAVGRSSQNVALTLIGGEATADMAHIGAAGGLFNNGWEQTSLEFELTEKTTVSIGARGATNVIHNWMSFSDFRLVRFPGRILSGKCGANVDFVLTGDYTLTISGTGDMFDYDYNTQPWKDYKYQINNVVIEDGVTGIGNYAFNYCYGLTSVAIPNSVTSIGLSAFSVCSSLTSITIPNSVTSIGSSAFSGCSGLTSVTIPNSVTSIGNSAFYGCSGLTSVTIPNSVTSIGNSAFYGCSLKSITIGNSVTSIGSYAFQSCSGLTSVTCLAENVPTTGNYVFSGVPQSTATLYVPAGSVDAYKAAEQWKEFGTITANLPVIISFADANVKAICVANWDTNGDGELSETEAAAVTSLGEVFKYNTTITSFDELQYFTGLTTIGDYAFSGCTGLTSVTIPESVTSIGDCAFSGCTGLTSVTIPNSVTSIGRNAFSGCSGLASIEIPNSVTTIGKYAFYICSGLTSIYVDSNNSVYDSRNNCNAIIETSSNTLISGCKNTVIPNSVTSIGECAFDGCSGLTSIIIPNSVTSIGNSAFSGCSGLTSVTIPESVTSIGDGAFGGCSGLTSIAIPNSVTSISNSAFSGCSGLTSVTIGNGVTSIGYGAFWGCSGLTSITIPNSVTSIGNYAFFNCSGLTSVICLAENVPNTGSNVFYNVPKSTATLYVPAGSVDAYKAADEWKNFGTIAAYSIPATSVALNKTETTLAVGAKEQLTATVLPEGATNKAVTWTTSDPAVATVDESGLITAIAAGTATITATTTDGTDLTASCKVTVEDPAIPGDVNGDGNVNGADIVAVINYVLADDIAGDVNGDGNVNGADIVVVINYVLNDSGNNARQTVAQSRAAAVEEPTEILSGTKTDEGISLSLTGGEDCTAFQFMLSLPEGVSLTAVTGSEERLGDHELLFRRQEDGRYLVLGYAMDNHCIGESSGELLSLRLEGNANGRATVSEALIFTPQAETRYMNALDIDLPTVVSGVRAKGAADEGGIYDLGGRKLNKKPSSGYYIRGGKKYFVK